MRQQTILGQKYVLGDQLGKGGIGVVYVGYDLQARRSVAVKILKPEHTADEKALARFEQEAKIARQISHENVAKVYDFGRDGDTRFIVLELLGPTLQDLLDSRKRIPPKSAARIVCQVLAGLGAAHRAGIVHRDVKPSNVLFLERSGEPDPLRVKIGDFGIARIASARSQTAAGSFFGTVRYVSPEQASGQQVGPASDLYSTGILLYQLLTGAFPFDGENDVEIIQKQLKDIPRPPSQLAPGIPPRLEAIVLRSLEKEPALRWPDAETMCAALATYDQSPSQWPADQTRAVASPLDTRAWSSTQSPKPNGGAQAQPLNPTARLEAVRSARLRPVQGASRWWVAPIGLVTALLIAVVLGVLLGVFALGATPIGLASPPGATATPSASRGVTGGASATKVTLSASAFDGGCLAGTIPARVIGGTLLLGQASSCPTAVAQFDLASRPRGAAAIHLTALNSPLGAPVVAVVVNGKQVFKGQLDLPSDGGYGVATLTLADGTLRAGQNRLEVRNLATDAQPELGPWLILSGAEVTWG